MAAARRTLATQPKPSGIPASPNVLDPAIPLKPLRPRREHVSYVSAQVRGHLRLPAVGKSDELHNLDMTTRVGAEASDTLKYFSERLPSTFVYSGIGLDRGPCWPAPAATRSPAGSPSSRPARSPPARNGLPSSPPSKAPCGSTTTRRRPRHARGLPAPPHPRDDRQPALAQAPQALFQAAAYPEAIAAAAAVCARAPDSALTAHNA
jgi:hypothetical protein